MPRCKTCKDKFEAKVFLQKNCMLKPECIEAELQHKKKLKQKSWNKEKAVRKEALKTRTDYLKELQVVFNKFIRLRDKGNNCISCNKPAKKENAGHYRSVGGNPELRFEESNCYLQCEYCNTYNHGNLINYRINLIKKIGIDKVEWLEGKHEPKNYTVEELKGLKVMYKLKIKQLEK
ncbi:MAG: recombination protein NinG [Gammaproteobacteria bacterium]|nr:recombination protein NinG [Gammaproteobacteria bacterium]